MYIYTLYYNLCLLYRLCNSNKNITKIYSKTSIIFLRKQLIIDENIVSCHNGIIIVIDNNLLISY